MGGGLLDLWATTYGRRLVGGGGMSVLQRVKAVKAAISGDGAEAAISGDDGCRIPEQGTLVPSIGGSMGKYPPGWCTHKEGAMVRT